MALVKPVLSSVPAFDAKQQMIFEFSANGGDTIVGSKLTIKENDTGTVVYSETKTSSLYNHILDANTLTNNKYYMASIQTQNSSGDFSASSNSIQFWCFTLPTITFINIPSNRIIEASSYNFEATYNQLEGELLNSYGFILYDSDDNIIKDINSGNRTYIYDVTPPPTALNHSFSNLEDGVTYKVQAVGYTKYDTVVYSNKEQFSVKYGSSQFTTGISLTNNCKDGTVLVQCAIHDLTGESTNGDVVYLTEGSVISADLKNNSAIWKEQLSFNENYTTYITGRNFTNNSVICKLGSKTEMIYREFLNDSTNEYMCHIELLNTFDNNGIYKYRVYSNDIPKPAVTDYLVIYMICGNDLMDIQIENIGGAS